MLKGVVQEESTSKLSGNIARERIITGTLGYCECCFFHVFQPNVQETLNVG